MKKSEWEEGLKRLEAILIDAKDTQTKSLRDIEELEFTINSYKKKIAKMPDENKKDKTIPIGVG